MCSSNQILNSAPGMLIRSSRDNEALNSSKETLVVLGDTFNSWMKLQISRKSLPSSPPALCLQVQVYQPFARLPPQDRRRHKTAAAAARSSLALARLLEVRLQFHLQVRHQ